LAQDEEEEEEVQEECGRKEVRKESAQGKEKKVFFCTISKISFEKIFLVVGVNVRENMRRGI